MPRASIKKGDKFTSGKGCESVVVEYIDAFHVRIQFQDEHKYIATVEAGNLRDGRVRNPYRPSVFGIGYIASGAYNASMSGKKTKAYSNWQGMIQRCYDEKKLAEYPSYKGCSVVPGWHNFQVFAAWHEEHYTEGLELDKDYLIAGNKIYGPDTCCYLSHQQNIEASHAKHYSFISPDGVVHDIFNLRKFCRGRGLDDTKMGNVSTGKAVRHKGWTATI